MVSTSEVPFSDRVFAAWLETAGQLVYVPGANSDNIPSPETIRMSRNIRPKVASVAADRILKKEIEFSILDVLLRLNK